LTLTIASPDARATRPAGSPCETGCFARIIAASDSRDAVQRARLEQLAEARAAGYAEGVDAGRREVHASYSEAAARLVAEVHGRTSGPTHVELERRRWGAGGRAHFADPRPGDYLGGPVAWAPGWAPGSGHAPETAAAA
jgi:hypothetical protein